MKILNSILYTILSLFACSFTLQAQEVWSANSEDALINRIEITRYTNPRTPNSVIGTVNFTFNNGEAIRGADLLPCSLLSNPLVGGNVSLEGEMGGACDSFLKYYCQEAEGNSSRKVCDALAFRMKDGELCVTHFNFFEEPDPTQITITYEIDCFTKEKNKRPISKKLPTFKTNKKPSSNKNILNPASPLCLSCPPFGGYDKFMKGELRKLKAIKIKR